MRDGTAEFRGLLSRWLAITFAGDVPTGLAREEALAHAAGFYQEMLEGCLPQLTSVDEDSKDVLYALVEKLEQTERVDPQQLVRLADVVYRMIRINDWADDAFDEKRSLLERCATIGWGAIGQTLGIVSQRRKAASSTDPFEVCLASSGRHVFEPADAYPKPDILDGTCRDLELQIDLDPDTAVQVVGSAIASLFATLLSSPRGVAFWARRLYGRLKTARRRVGVFDEHEYLLGVIAFLAADAGRHVGDYETSARWLTEASCEFQQTLVPEPLLLKVACERLSLDVITYRHASAAAEAPALILQCEAAGLERDALKARIVEAFALKDDGLFREAEPRLSLVLQRGELTKQKALRLTALIGYAEVLSALGRFSESDASFAEACGIADPIRFPGLCAYLQSALAESLRDRGQPEEAVGRYRAAVEIYERAEMSSLAAYGRLVLAEALLLVGCYREAEVEIRLALPVIEERGLIREGFVALALVRESIRQRQDDRDALKQLREHLKKRI